MRSSGLFAPDQQGDFSDELVAVVNAYIKRNEGKFLKRTGVARARKFKERLTALQQENLTPVQFKWRICSYIKLEMGVGPFDTSTELRKDVLNLLVSAKGLNADEEQINLLKLGHLQQELLVLRHCAEVGVAYRIDNDKIEIKAKTKAAELTLQSLKITHADASQENKEKLLAAVDAYIADVESVWYKRWFKQTGLERARELKVLITHLSEVEGLNDRQLCARMYELAHMPIAGDEGIFDTSKDLRLAVMETLCECLGVDEEKVKRDIHFKTTPTFMPTTLGPSGRVPNVALESIFVRDRYLANALHSAPANTSSPVLR